MRTSIFYCLFRCLPSLAIAGLLIVASGSAFAQPAEQEIPLSDRMRVRLGAAKEKIYDASRIARNYIGYAVLAARSYDRFLDGKLTATDDESEKYHSSKHGFKYRPDDKGFITAGGRSWQFAGGREGRQCPNGEPCLAWDGLGVHFWKRKSKRVSGYCAEVVLAFRGTELGVPGSLGSNLNPLTMFRPFAVFMRIVAPGADHYHQVRVNVDNWVKELRANGCQNARFVAVGHSLGGGLARHAAYQNSWISRVVTFNTSPVDSWHTADAVSRERNVKGLEIDNVVERGEFLGALRAPVNSWHPPKGCDPQERTIAINASRGLNIFSQHSSWAMTASLHEWDKRGRGVRRREMKLPQLEPHEKASANCLVGDRDAYMAANDPARAGERRIRPAVTVQPTPPERRGR